MAKQRIGLQTFFAPNQPGFTEQFAEYATVQRGRKEAALGEIRKTLSEKQVYSAYAANANKLLEDQVKQIAGSLDVDPTAYTDAVNDYLKFYNYSEQFKSFINDAATSYKADKEVDYNTALSAMQKQYVKNGTLDELEQNIINGVDAEKVLLETPGALKADEVIKNRLDKLGSVDKLVEEAERRLQPEQAGYPFIYQESQSIRQRINNAVAFDDKGNIQVKDIAELERLGILDTMYSDARVDAVVKQRLTSQGTEITEDSKRQALREMLTPFASGEFQRKEDVKMMQDPGAVAARSAGAEGKPLELLSTKLDNMYNGVEALAAGESTQDWKPYKREGAKSPAGKPYTHFSALFNGEVADRSGKQFAIDGLFMDSNYNVYIRGREILKGEAVEAGPDMDTPEGLKAAKEAAKRPTAAAAPSSKVNYGAQTIFEFDPALIELRSTSSMQDEYNKFAATRREQFRAFKQNVSPQSTTPMTIEEMKKKKEQDKKAEAEKQRTQQESQFDLDNYLNQ